MSPISHVDISDLASSKRVGTWRLFILHWNEMEIMQEFQGSRPLLLIPAVALYGRSCMVNMVFFMHPLYLHVVLHGDCTVDKIGYTFARQILFSVFFLLVHVHNVYLNVILVLCHS